MDMAEKEIVFLEQARVCRVCLQDDQNSKCIFNDKSSFSLVQKLVYYGGIEILENDGLPDRICLQCISKIDSAHEFRIQCQIADQRLRQMFGKPQTLYSFSTLTDTKDENCQTNLAGPSRSRPFENAETKYDLKNNDDKVCNSNLASTLHIEQADQTVEKENRIEDEACSQKEVPKARRASVFKRVTSMENLKSHRERQRQYIKKSSKLDDSKRKKITTETDDECITTCDQGGFKCAQCDKQFSKQDKLLSHEKLHESKVKCEPVICQICDKSFRKNDTMVRHLNLHKKANPKEVFSILKEMRDKRRMDNNPLIAEMEGNCSDENKEELDVEHIDFSGGNHDDNETLGASNTSVYGSNYRSSLDNIKDEKTFSCSVCSMKFNRQDKLNSHKEKHGHVPLEKPSDDKSALKLINSWIRQELVSDNDNKTFPCETCGKSYATRKSLTKHRSTVHDESTENKGQKDCSCPEKAKAEKLKPYSCTECNKSFEKEGKLEKHKRIHERSKEQQDSNFKRFLCHICSKTFRQNTGLMFHMRTHTGYKPHVCKYCGRGFTSNSNCINHERTHTGDRPFVCHFCSAAFAKSCTLKAHITTHTGEANYHCKTCGKSFRRLKYLKEHRFTHTGEKPYACKLCGTAYSHSGSLFVHEKKCKAHFNNANFQSPAGQNSVGTFCQQGEVTIGVTQTAPLITTLPVSNQIAGEISNVIHGGKGFVDMQRTAQVAMGENPALVHPATEVQEMQAVKNFTIIGQIFHG